MDRFWKAQVDVKHKCNIFKATVQGALLSGLCPFAGQNGRFTENELLSLGACQRKLARMS